MLRNCYETFSLPFFCFCIFLANRVPIRNCSSSSSSSSFPIPVFLIANTPILAGAVGSPGALNLTKFSPNWVCVLNCCVTISFTKSHFWADVSLSREAMVKLRTPQGFFKFRESEAVIRMAELRRTYGNGHNLQLRQCTKKYMTNHAILTILHFILIWVADGELVLFIYLKLWVTGPGPSNLHLDKCRSLISNIYPHDLNRLVEFKDDKFTAAF